MPDARVDLCRGVLERRVAGVVCVARRRVGDAPVDPAGVVRELGAGLAGLVAQRDQMVEPAGGKACRWVAAAGRRCRCRTARPALARRGGAGAVWVGCRRSTPPRGRRCGGAAALRLSVSGRCCRCTRTARRHVAEDGARWTGSRARRLAQGGVQRGAGLGQSLRAAVQVQVVVAVAAVEAAAPGSDQPAITQQPQVVGHQVLRLADQCHQLADPVVAVG